MAATQALETIALRCCWGGGGTKNGRACVQDALLSSNENYAHHGGKKGGNEGVSSATSAGAAVYYSGGNDGASEADTCDVSAVSAATGCSFSEVDGDDVGNGTDTSTGTGTIDSQERKALVVLVRDGKCAEDTKNSGQSHAYWEREGSKIGATSFALRVADSYSRGDSRTIVRRAGAARVAASALSLLRALLTDSGQRRQVDGDVETKGRGEVETEIGQDEASLACCVQEFCDEQVLALSGICSKRAGFCRRDNNVDRRPSCAGAVCL